MTLTLNKLAHFQGRQGPLLLMILDGVGIGREYEGNAVYMARTPVLDELMKGPLVTQLKAHGPAVGLPSEDDMGNSEVGHNAIGAGRVFAQGAKLVGLSIRSGDIFKTDVWSTIIERGRAGDAVHFIGLLSDGNVHSHIDQLYALINRCADEGIEKVRVHALLDGRDVGEKSALDYIKPTQELLKRISVEKNYDYVIASGGGRMVTTMDRYEADWTIVERGWNAHVHGIGRGFPSAAQAVQTLYDEDPKITDQYLGHFVIVDHDGEPVGRVQDGDSVINFNFRGDRAIEISRAFTEENFSKFDRGAVPDVFYAGMMEYDGDLHIPRNYLVNPPEIDRTLSEYLCGCGMRMFAISETQKFGHVTYFWNGNRSGYIDKTLETYVEIPSDKIAFDRAPKMKAMEITDKTIELLRSGRYRFGRLNFANGDMVGHTGVMEAAIVAMETVDACVGRLLKVVAELDGIAIITADHGNLDEMWTEKNGVRTPKTAHTLNPVPFIIVDKNYRGEYKMAQLDDPGLANIAATIFNLLGFENAADYNPSLITFV
ncbi:2,3-bisphosphoglycerate-independent phosphoglycerate mutase [candidate division KSB1 bacterium]|nr:2,3-bisphosphoglycerate-independent phosphoglycerate mutase [candidate division KSB1 bacterium]